MAKYSYDDAGRLIKTTLTDMTEKILQQAAYDWLGNILTQTDGNGNTTAYSYNKLGLLRRRMTLNDSTIAANIIRNQYDVKGQLAYQTDSMGKDLIYTYNQNGQVLLQTERKEDGSHSITLSNAYDKNGNIRFETDANGVTTEYVYDALNRVLSVNTLVDNVNHITTNTYDGNGNILTTTDWLGNAYTNEYDALNRLVKKTDPYGKVIEKYEYNDNHVQIAAYDDLNNFTSYTYDKNNRLLTITDPEGHITSQSYDVVGNTASRTDGMNNVTTFHYDALNRLIEVTNAKNEITGYTYDLAGNILTQTDGSGNTVTYSYNTANLPIRKADPNAGTDADKMEWYTYYADGTLRTKQDRNGNITTYIYDIHGNLSSETTGSAVKAFTYDNNGNMLAMTDTTGTTSRTYDELGRVLTKDVPYVGTITYVYDITDGADTGEYKERSTDPKGNITEKLYDKTGRLSKVINGSNETAYSYYDNGNTESVTYSNDFKEVYTYYADNQLESLVNLDAGGNIMDSYSYTYDNAGNLLTKYELINGTAKDTTTYTYDALNRLLTVMESSGNTTAYNYDGAGNRIQETAVSGSTTTVNTYSYNDQNRLTAVTTRVNNEITKVTDYTYDNNGNQLITEVKTYVDGALSSTETVQDNTYNEYNQLIQTISEDGTVISNTYNAEGYRVKKEADGEITCYLYEADKVILELDETGSQTARNVYGINLLTRTEDGETYYYMYNGHADVTALVSDIGSVAASYYYDAFGNILESTGDVNNSILYSGYQYDEETGLYYLNARMYDPKTARFLQQDTYSGDRNDPLSLNLYTYCANNPIIYWDPTGHELWKLSTLLEKIGGSMETDLGNNSLVVTANGRTQEYDLNELYYFNGSYIIDDRLFKKDFNYHTSFLDFKKKLKLNSKDNDIRDLNNYEYTLRDFQNEPLYNYLAEGTKFYYEGFVENYGEIGFYFVNSKISKLYSLMAEEKGNLTSREGYTFGLSKDDIALIGLQNTASQYGLTMPDMELAFQEQQNDKMNAFLFISFFGPGYQGLPKGPIDPDFRLQNGQYIQTTNSYGYISNGYGWSLFNGAGKVTGNDIQFSDKLSNSQWQKQINSRGWSNDSIANTINKPYTTRVATNRATGNSATAFYNQNGSYIIRDNVTGKVVQVSDIANPNWTPDPSIINPYLP
jgi:RHS repeat-associated protein